MYVTSPSLSELGFKNGSKRLYFVSTLCTSFFICTPLTFLPLPGGGGAGDMLSPFSDFGFENGLTRLYFVSAWFVYIFFSFVRLLLFYLSLGREHAIPPFLILDSKMGSIICISLVHDCIHLFSFVNLLFFTSFWKGWGHAIPSFSDFGFENRLNRLYFVTTWLFTSFFVCPPLTFLPLSGGGVAFYPPFSDFGFWNVLNHLYFVSTWLYTSFFVCTPNSIVSIPHYSTCDTWKTHEKTS